MNHLIINPAKIEDYFLFRNTLSEENRHELITMMVSALRYYGGIPDTILFDIPTFDSKVALATKAYTTFNTLTGVASAAKDRHGEHKEQTPGLLTLKGIDKTLEMYKLLFMYAITTHEDVNFETFRACRMSEIIPDKMEEMPEIGVTNEFTVTALTSTSKSGFEELYAKYGKNKRGLVLATYRLHGPRVCDMEKMGDYYCAPKSDEREVLILPGDRLVATYLGVNEEYRGSDGKAAMMFVIDVYPPADLEKEPENEDIVLWKSIVLEPKALAEIQQYFTALNDFSKLPPEPECYRGWQHYFKLLVMHQLTEAKLIVG